MKFKLSSPIGKRVRFDADFLHVDLADGRVISTPMRWYPELSAASLADVSNYKFICDGTGIEWPMLDYHLSVESMLMAPMPSPAQSAKRQPPLPVSKLADADMQAVPAALARAAQRARDLAARTGTPMIYVENGKLIEEMVPPSEAGQ
jgi:hypothetical protein